MPVEDIAEFALRGLARLLLHVLVEVVWELVCYIAGLCTLRLLTLGSYPPRELTEKQVILCQVLGVIEILGSLAAGFVFAARL